MFRSLIPTWRFFDRPDVVWEIQVDDGPWCRVNQSTRFRGAKLWVDAEAIELAWIETQLRRTLEYAEQEWDRRYFQALGDRWCRVKALSCGRHYAFRARDMLDQSISAQIAWAPDEERAAR